MVQQQRIFCWSQCHGRFCKVQGPKQRCCKLHKCCSAVFKTFGRNSQFFLGHNSSVQIWLHLKLLDFFQLRSHSAKDMSTIPKPAAYFYPISWVWAGPKPERSQPIRGKCQWINSNTNWPNFQNTLFNVRKTVCVENAPHFGIP